MSLTPFVDIRLPDDVERGATGGPGFNTTIVTLDSGFERRNSNWAQARASYDIGYGIEYKEDMEDVIKFFYARRGKAVGFRFKDWADYEMPDQTIAIGVNADTRLTFQLFKRYADDGGFYDRVIRKPVIDSEAVSRGGTLITKGPGPMQYTIDYNTGIITLGSELNEDEVLAARCQFDVPVRFDTDKLNITMETFQAGSIPSIPIVELKQL